MLYGIRLQSCFVENKKLSLFISKHFAFPTALTEWVAVRSIDKERFMVLSVTTKSCRAAKGNE